MAAGWCSRTVRAAVFAAVCVLLAALGHVMMSGSYVPGWALGAGAAVTGAVGWGLAGRERGLPLVVTVVVSAQAALHSTFSLAQSAFRGSASTHMSGMGSMRMSVDMGSASMDSVDMGHMTTGHMDHMGHSVGGDSSAYGMLVAHLLAALLSGLWLAYGEKAVFRTLRAAAGWLAAPLRLLLVAPHVPDRPRVRPRRPGSDRAPSPRLLVHAITSRGPPVGTAAI